MTSLLKIILVLTAIGLSCTELRYAPSFAFFPLLSAALVGIIAGCAPDRWSARALGVGILTVSFFGFQGVNLFAGCWLLGRIGRAKFSSEEESAPFVNRRYEAELGFVVLLLSWCIAGLRAWRFEYDGLLFHDLSSAAGIRGVITYLVQNPRVWNAVPLLLAGYALAALSFVELGRRSEMSEGFLEGLAAGAIFSASMLFLQLMDFSPELSFNRGAFWRLTGRFPGLASDPNAFGVVAALLVPAFFLRGAAKRRRLFYPAGAMLLCAAPWTGSRTFWVGMILCAAHMLWQRFAADSRRLAVGLLCAAVGMAFLLGMPRINDALQKIIPSPGLSRVLDTLHWEKADSMLSSRTEFARIAIAVWQEAPILGVGLGRFYSHEAEAAKRAGVELGTWRDNANSFYLQVLSEGGLLGLVLIAFSFYLFLRALQQDGKQSEETAAASLLLILLLVLLVTGPHLLFDELKYIFAGILAFGVSHARVDIPAGEKMQAARGIKRWAAFAALCAVIFFVHTGKRAALQGVYGRETGEDGPFFWTGKNARIALCPSGKDEVTLQVRAMNPDISAHPLEVLLAADEAGGEPGLRRVTLTSTEWHEMRISLGTTWPESTPLWVELRSDRVWSPSEGSKGGDPRWFGVMVKYPKEICSYGALHAD